MVRMEEKGNLLNMHRSESLLQYIFVYLGYELKDHLTNGRRGVGLRSVAYVARYLLVRLLDHSDMLNPCNNRPTSHSNVLHIVSHGLGLTFRRVSTSTAIKLVA